MLLSTRASVETSLGSCPLLHPHRLPLSPCRFLANSKNILKSSHLRDFAPNWFFCLEFSPLRATHDWLPAPRSAPLWPACPMPVFPALHLFIFQLRLNTEKQCFFLSTAFWNKCTFWGSAFPTRIYIPQSILPGLANKNTGYSVTFAFRKSED